MKDGFRWVSLRFSKEVWSEDKSLLYLNGGMNRGTGGEWGERILYTRYYQKDAMPAVLCIFCFVFF